MNEIAFVYLYDYRLSRQPPRLTHAGEGPQLASPWQRSVHLVTGKGYG